MMFFHKMKIGYVPEQHALAVYCTKCGKIFYWTGAKAPLKFPRLNTRTTSKYPYLRVKKEGL